MGHPFSGEGDAKGGPPADLEKTEMFVLNLKIPL